MCLSMLDAHRWGDPGGMSGGAHQRGVRMRAAAHLLMDDDNADVARSRAEENLEATKRGMLLDAQRRSERRVEALRRYDRAGRLHGRHAGKASMDADAYGVAAAGVAAVAAAAAVASAAADTALASASASRETTANGRRPPQATPNTSDGAGGSGMGSRSPSRSNGIHDESLGLLPPRVVKSPGKFNVEMSRANSTIERLAAEEALTREVIADGARVGLPRLPSQSRLSPKGTLPVSPSGAIMYSSAEAAQFEVPLQMRQPMMGVTAQWQGQG